MSGEERREKILELLQSANAPLSGTQMARSLGVSRQIIVQDIALLRAVNKNILSTNKGYILFREKEALKKCRRAIRVSHSDEQIKDELYTIVDLGGHVLDVVVEHEIYGQITCDLIIHSRQDVDLFVQQCKQRNARGLSSLTAGVHYHAVEAATEAVLDAIENALREKGYLHIG